MHTDTDTQAHEYHQDCFIHLSFRLSYFEAKYAENGQIFVFDFKTSNESYMMSLFVTKCRFP